MSTLALQESRGLPSTISRIATHPIIESVPTQFCAFKLGQLETDFSSTLVRGYGSKMDGPLSLQADLILFYATCSSARQIYNPEFPGWKTSVYQEVSREIGPLAAILLQSGRCEKALLTEARSCAVGVSSSMPVAIVKDGERVSGLQRK
jgi:hypothetical protein